MKKIFLISLFFLKSFSLMQAQTQSVSRPETDTKKPNIYQPSNQTEADTTAPLPTDFMMVEVEPQPLNMNEIKISIGYPPLAVKKNIEGKVVVQLLIDEEGNPIKYMILKNPNQFLTDGVTSKIMDLRFSPGQQKGKKIKVWVTIPFIFKLKH